MISVTLATLGSAIPITSFTCEIVHLTKSLHKIPSKSQPLRSPTERSGLAFDPSPSIELRVDPEPRSFTPSSKTGLGAAERVNEKSMKWVIPHKVRKNLSSLAFGSFMMALTRNFGMADSTGWAS